MFHVKRGKCTTRANNSHVCVVNVTSVQCRTRKTQQRLQGSNVFLSTSPSGYIVPLVFNIGYVLILPDRLCGLAVRVLGYRSGGPGSIPGTTRKK
jgi:hypothetical protein